MSFKRLKINHRVIENLNRLDIKKPTEIQNEAIPKILNGSNLIAKAQTGSGKTLAFMAPIITKTIQNESLKSLIIAPTRDLANQIFENTKNFIKGTNIKTDVFYGGVSYNRQIKMLSKNLNIIIGTPGRIIDLSSKKFLKLDQIDFLVIDEADEMFDMGFIKDVKKIIKAMSKRKQTILFSATISQKIKKLVEDIVSKYDYIEVKSKNDLNEAIQQTIYFVHKNNKLDLLKDVLEKNFCQCIIFTKTIREVKWLTYQLTKEKYKVESLHSDRRQTSRTNALKKFRENEVDILIATNVAARGIDINNLGLIINFSMANNVESYIHRIGRTGRIGNKGKAISFIEKGDMELFEKIKKRTNANFEIINNFSQSQKNNSSRNISKDKKIKKVNKKAKDFKKPIPAKTKNKKKFKIKKLNNKNLVFKKKK